LTNPVVDTFTAEILLFSDDLVKTNDDISFFAGQSIELLPGFEVQLGAEFTAQIEACSQVYDSPVTRKWYEELDPGEKAILEEKFQERLNWLEKQKSK